MSKIEDRVANGLTDSETKNNTSLKRRGVRSFRINSSDPSVEIRRPATAQVVSHQKHHPAERTSSISYKPPFNKKKETVSSDSGRSPGTIYAAIGYITSPARYIGSLFTGKKEPMVVKSAPTLNKEKVKTINTKKMKEPLSEITPDGGDLSPTPTMLSASNTTVGNNSSLIKKSDNKTDGKKTSNVSKRSISQNSKYAHKSRTSPITLKDKKLTSPVQAAPEVKVIPASNVKITTATMGAFRVSSKNKEEPPPKTKKDMRKTSPERKTKTVPQTLTASTPTTMAKKQHLLNTLMEKMDRPEETSGPSEMTNGPSVITDGPTVLTNGPTVLTNGPSVLTCLQPSFLPSEDNSSDIPTSKYPSKLKKMVGGARSYERAEEVIPTQLSNKCSPDYSNVDIELTPTVLYPTCLETDGVYLDTPNNVTIVALSANTLVNSPSLSNIDSYEKGNKANVDNETNKFPSPLFPTLLFPTILPSPTDYQKSYTPNRMTSPQSKPVHQNDSDASPYQNPEKKRKSASYKPPGSFSPSRNVNGNFQPLSPGDSDKTSSVDAPSNALVAAEPAQRTVAHASYRVISPERLPINFQDHGKHKYRSTSRSPSRSTMPYPQSRSMNSYTERYNALKNKKKIPNRGRSPYVNGNRQGQNSKPDSDNPVILVMPSRKFKELVEENKPIEPVQERIMVTSSGSYKVTTKPSDTTVTKKPSNSNLTLGEASTSNQVLGPDNVHSNKQAIEGQALISSNSPEKEKSHDVDTKPPCKGIMLKSPQAPLLSSKVSDKNFVQETVRRLKNSYANKEVDYFNSLDHYGGSPAQHAAASTMLGEFP